MPYCTRCGTELPPDAAYCPNCGAPVVACEPTIPRAATPSAQPPTKTSFKDRMIRAMKLDATLYEEVEVDEAAAKQVIGIIAIVSICGGIGLGLSALLRGRHIGFIAGWIILDFITTLASLAIWAYLIYIVGTKLFGGQATFKETWRCAGFAFSPGVFRIIPVIGEIASIWIIVAQVIAARQALDVSTGKAIAACIVSFIPYAIIIVAIRVLALLL
jgi:hypothetical protein